MFDEVRTIDLYEGEDAIFCDIHSNRIANYAPLRFPRCKHGTIGVRLNPQLLNLFGGDFTRWSDGPRGGFRSGPFSDRYQTADFLFAEANPKGALGRYGIGFAPLAAGLQDWFDPWYKEAAWSVRNHGVVLLNPRVTNDDLELEVGESWSMGLRVVAYDGKVSEKRLRAWRGDALPRHE